MCATPAKGGLPAVAVSFLTLAACTSPDSSEPDAQDVEMGPQQPAGGDPDDEQQGLETPQTPSDEPNDDIVEPAEHSRVDLDLAPAADGTGDFEITVFATEWLDELVSVELTLVADDGSGKRASVALGTVEVEPGGVVDVQATVGSTEFDLEALEFAGRLEVVAHIAGAEGAVEPAISMPLFFWPDGADGLSVVDELPEHRGDFKGSVLPALVDNDDDGIRLDRVVGNAVAEPAEDLPGTLGLPGGAHQDLSAVELEPTTQAVSKTLCARLEVSTVDSAIMFRPTAGTPGGGAVPSADPPEEDWGATTGDGSTENGWWRPTQDWLARNAGYRLCKVDSGTGLCVYGPTAYLGANGCVSVQVDVGPTYIFELQSRAEDANGNHWRTYEGPSGCDGTCTQDRPGSVLATTTSFTFGAGSTKNLYLTGADQDFWSTAAIVGTSLYRQPHGLSDTNLNACLTSAGNSQSVDPNDWTLGRACLEIGNLTQPRRKYLIAHEIGHAVGYMSAGEDFYGATRDYDAEYEKDGPSYSNNETGTPASAYCTGPGGTAPNGGNVVDWIDSDQDRLSDPGECYGPCVNYNLNTIEWDAVAFREAFAHFYAIRVMNDRARVAVFTWRNTPDNNGDLVKFSLDDDDDGIPNGLGRMHSVCCEQTGSPSAPSNCDNDASTIRDWTGALWNWYASYWDEACAGDDWVDWSDVIAVVDQTIQEIDGDDDPSGDTDVQKKRAWEEFRDAVQDQWPASTTDCQYETWVDQGEQFQLWN